MIKVYEQRRHKYKMYDARLLEATVDEGNVYNVSQHYKMLSAVWWIRILRFFGLPVPDSDQSFLYGSRSFHQQAKKEEKNLDFFYTATFF